VIFYPSQVDVTGLEKAEEPIDACKDYRMKRGRDKNM
jgi:hypothetical protein